MSRCETIPFPNGGYCVDCAEQPLIEAVPGHIDNVTVRSWDAGADSVAMLETPCYFQFKVAVNPGGEFVGMFNGAVSRYQPDPTTLDVAIYVFTEGSSTLAQAYKNGVLVGDPVGFTPGTLFRIERHYDVVVFKSAGTEFARTTMTDGLTRCGACLYQSGDSVSDEEFDVFTGSTNDAVGAGSIFIKAAGDTNDSYGRASITLKAVGETGSYGNANITLLAGGNSEENYGYASITIFGRGYGDIETPRPNYGEASIFLKATGTLQFPNYATGHANLFITAQGDSEENYGRASIFLRAAGAADPPILEDFIIGLQSPGSSQLVFGYDAYTLSDTITFSDRIVSTLRILLADTIKLSDSLGTQAALHAMLTDVLGLSDSFTFHFLAIMQDTLSLSDSFAMQMELSALIDTMVLTDAMPNVLTAYQLIASSLVLRDSMKEYRILALQDEITLNDTLNSKLSAHVKMLDEIEFSDTLAGTGQFVAIMPDSIQFEDTMQSRMDAIIRMQDQIDFSIRLYTDNGEYIAFAMNTETTGVTKYDNFGFNSMVEINGTLLASSERGLFAIGDDHDEGADINAFIETGLDNLSMIGFKRILKGYLSFRSNGTMLITVVTTSPEGIKKAETYRAAPVLADDYRETNVDIGKGLRSVMWRFRIANENGSDVDFKGLYLIPLQCGKRANG